MLKKILVVIICASLIASTISVDVKADSYCGLESTPYEGYGECGITASTGYAKTYVDPLAATQVSATFSYNRFYGTSYVYAVNQPGSAGGHGSCRVDFSVYDSSTDRSISVNASHSFDSGSSGHSASGVTSITL